MSSSCPSAEKLKQHQDGKASKSELVSNRLLNLLSGKLIGKNPNGTGMNQRWNSRGSPSGRPRVIVMYVGRGIAM